MTTSSIVKYDSEASKSEEGEGKQVSNRDHRVAIVKVNKVSVRATAQNWA